jgi:hypothetical protein
VTSVEHTGPCEDARTGHPGSPWPELRWLYEEEVEAVLACPHPSHDAVRVALAVRHQDLAGG